MVCMIGFWNCGIILNFDVLYNHLLKVAVVVVESSFWMYLIMTEKNYNGVGMLVFYCFWKLGVFIFFCCNSQWFKFYKCHFFSNLRNVRPIYLAKLIPWATTRSKEKLVTPPNMISFYAGCLHTVRFIMNLLSFFLILQGMQCSLTTIFYLIFIQGIWFLIFSPNCYLCLFHDV